MIQRNLFPISIYHTDLNISSNIKEEMRTKIYKIKDKHQGSSISNSGGWHSSDIDLFSLDEFKFLNKKINECLVELIDTYYSKLKSFGSGGRFPIKNRFEDYDLNELVVENWAIINGYGHSNHIHNHPNNWLSGVYYLSVPPNSGDLRFLDMVSSRMHEGYFYTPSNLEEELSGVIVPKNDNLVIFPAWLPHAVGQNKSKQDRIVVSFNVPYPFLGVEPLVIKEKNVR